MSHAMRGHRSSAYEISNISNVNLDDLTITIHHAGKYRPQKHRLSSVNTPAAQQMLQGMADSIKIGSTSDKDSGWESAQTLEKSFWTAKVMLHVLYEAGIDSFDDERINVPLLRTLYAPMESAQARSAVWLLARVIKDNHPRGSAIAVALKNTRFPALEHDPFTYDEEISAAIEAAAKAVYTARYIAQRELFENLGHDVKGRHWLSIPAEEMIEWAIQKHPTMCGTDDEQPPLGATYEQKVAWALTHPAYFGSRSGGPRVLRGQWAAIGTALYPDHVHLTAALILHCLAENAGYNYATLMEKSADSLTYLGENEALERSVKARNHSQDTTVTRTDSIYTSGGIVETLSGLTRFSRKSRDHLTSQDGQPSPMTVRLYVEHQSDPLRSELITTSRIHNGWRKKDFDDQWNPASAGKRADVPLRFNALRLEAHRRVMQQGLSADVHGHTESTKTHYTAHALPDHIFNAAAVKAQNAFHDDALAQFTFVSDSTEAVALQLAQVPAENIMDVEVGLCVSAGNEPGGSGKRCTLGITACFTCPNGYRTIDHIPGLLAAVELGNVIEANDPHEWENGEAADLRFYAQACLDKFTPLVVSNIRLKVDLTPHILIVTGMYLEMRHA